MDGWKIHFEKLATPSMNDSLDVERQNLCKLQNYIISTSTNTKIPITPTTCKEVMNAVEKLNTGKSADENGIQAKHFRNAKEELAPLLCEIINQIFQDLDIPDSMKSGILTPILKKGKDKNIPGNYRGIVVTNTFSKILESIIKDRLEEQLKKTQNPLQRGFKRVDSFAPCRIPCAMLILSVRLLSHLTVNVIPLYMLFIRDHISPSTPS
jgi:hypothetical protein